jgi:hypothetical protein
MGGFGDTGRLRGHSILLGEKISKKEEGFGDTAFCWGRKFRKKWEN